MKIHRKSFRAIYVALAACPLHAGPLYAQALPGIPNPAAVGLTPGGLPGPNWQ